VYRLDIGSETSFLERSGMEVARCGFAYRSPNLGDVNVNTFERQIGLGLFGAALTPLECLHYRWGRSREGRRIASRRCLGGSTLKPVEV